MTFQTPIQPRSKNTVRKSDPLKPFRSPAAQPPRSYGPCVLISKTIVKFVALTIFGCGMSILIFGAFKEHSTVKTLAELFQQAAFPTTVVVLSSLILGAIEESFH